MKHAWQVLLTVVLGMMLAGCGPSAKEKELETALKQEKEKVEALAAELEMQRQLVGELKEEVKKLTPPPEFEATGEVFVRAKSGETLKLVSARVGFFDAAMVRDHVVKKNAEKDRVLAELNGPFKAAKAEMQTTREKEEQMAKAAQEATPDDLAKARGDLAAARAAAKTAADAFYEVMRESRKVLDGRFYFEGLPAPLFSTRTGSDGKFFLKLPTGKPLVVGALGSPEEDAEIETSYWLLPLPAKPSGKVETILSSDNALNADTAKVLMN